MGIDTLLNPFNTLLNTNTEPSVRGGDYKFVAEHDDTGETDVFETFDELFAAELDDEEWTVHQYAV